MNDHNDDLLKRAQRFFNASSDKAEDIAKDSGEIDQLVDKSGKKMRNIDDGKYNFKNFFKQLITFQRMLRAYTRKEYPNLPWKSLLSIVGSLLYFLNPLDLIPDFIPGLGLVDDITLLGWVYKSVAKDVARFEEWEYHQNGRQMARR